MAIEVVVISLKFEENIYHWLVTRVSELIVLCYLQIPHYRNWVFIIILCCSNTLWSCAKYYLLQNYIAMLTGLIFVFITFYCHSWYTQIIRKLSVRGLRRGVGSMDYIHSVLIMEDDLEILIIQEAPILTKWQPVAVHLG